MKQYPVSLHLGDIDPEFALENARWIRDHVPLFEKSNGSGKFYRNYESTLFWHDSEQPLIKAFVNGIRAGREKFMATYERPLELTMINLTYVRDASEEICVWHQDGYWWTGQFHLTILGNGNLLVRDGSVTMHIQAESGSIWYLNGTDYQHKILNSWKGERFELLAPCNCREDAAFRRFPAVTETKERWIDATHPSIKFDTARTLEYMRESFAQGRASSKVVADWTSLEE